MPKILDEYQQKAERLIKVTEMIKHRRLNGENVPFIWKMEQDELIYKLKLMR